MGQQHYGASPDHPVTLSGTVGRGRCVGFGGAQATVAGQRVYGIAKTAGLAKDVATVTVMGTCVAEAGAEIAAAGTPLACDAQGRLVPAAALAVAAGATAVTSAAANGATAIVGGVAPVHVVAEALETAAGAGAFITVLIR